MLIRKKTALTTIFHSSNSGALFNKLSNVNIKQFGSNLSLFKQYKLTANLPRQLQPGI